VNTLEIYIENRRLDVSSELSSLLTFAIDDIKDFSARNTTFSKTIVLPGTANNNKLFGQIFDARVSNPYDNTADNVDTNFNASVSANCIMFQNHMQVFKGVLRVLEIVIVDGVPEYEVAVFGELGGLVAALGTMKLENLDFSAYDHVYNETNIVASWDNTPGSGYFYPLIDYGTASILKADWDIRTFRPALYVKEYLDKIFAAAGYRYSSALFETARFKSLVIPNNGKNLFSTNTNLFSANAVPEVFASDPEEVQFTGSVGSGFTLGGGNRQLTYAAAVASSPDIAYNFVVDPTSILTSLVFRILKDGVPVYTETRTAPGTGQQTFSGTLSGVSFDVGDVLEFQFEAVSSPGVIEVLSGSISITSTTAIIVTTEPGDDVVLNNNLPKNILQKDFLSSIIRLFNLYLYEDPNESKKVYLTPYVDFYNVSGTVDWDYKMDRSKVVRLKPMSELNFRYYNFKFKSDSDYYNDLYQKRYNEGYADLIFDSQYEFADEKKDIDVIFSATPLVGYPGEDKVFSTIFKLNAGVEERTESNIRILQSKKITGVTSWDILDGVSVLDSVTDYGYAGHYDDPDAPANDINFGVPRELFFTLVSGNISATQFNAYWSSYMAEITDKDSKLLTGSFKLNAADIYNLDFAKFIHLDGSYWRLNKIEDWNASEPDLCKVELLKLIYMFY
jgi:hypothetical protein